MRAKSLSPKASICLLRPLSPVHARTYGENTPKPWGRFFLTNYPPFLYIRPIAKQVLITISHSTMTFYIPPIPKQVFITWEKPCLLGSLGPNPLGTNDDRQAFEPPRPAEPLSPRRLPLYFERITASIQIFLWTDDGPVALLMGQRVFGTGIKTIGVSV